MNKILLFLASIGMLIVTSTSCAQSNAVICPDAKLVTCQKANESQHFYQSQGGVPSGSWTSDYLSGDCPDEQPGSTLGTSTINLNSGASLVNCTFTGGEKPTIFQTSKPDYCLASTHQGACPTEATKTSDGRNCVTYGNSNALGCTPSTGI